ncbi:retrotransposon protein, putative, ty1-copia subclass [Tanacetum coccineum]
MVYFSVIPRDGIFEIDLSNSYANESSILLNNKRAKQDLDSCSRCGIVVWNHITETALKSCNTWTSHSNNTLVFENAFLKSYASFAIATTLNHEEESKMDEPQSDLNPFRNLGEPANIKRIVRALRSENGLMTNKANAIHERQEVWILVDLPPNGKTVGSKWLFKKKTDIDGAVHTYKARLVVKGCTQTLGIDYKETFSPVADIRAIRILIAIAAFYDYEIWQMDVKTAFLNEYLSNEVYIEQTEGFVNPKYPNRVCKLKRSIYGLKQASRQWNK